MSPSPTFASNFSLSQSQANIVVTKNQSHSREAAARDFIRSRRVLLKDTPYNEASKPVKEKKTNSNDSREVHMVFQQLPPDLPARVTSKKLLTNHNDSIESDFTVQAEKWRSIMKIDKQKNSFSEQWMSFEKSSPSKPKQSASTYTVRTMDNMGLLED